MYMLWHLINCRIIIIIIIIIIVIICADSAILHAAADS